MKILVYTDSSGSRRRPVGVGLGTSSSVARRPRPHPGCGSRCARASLQWTARAPPRARDRGCSLTVGEGDHLHPSLGSIPPDPFYCCARDARAAMRQLGAARVEVDPADRDWIARGKRSGIARVDTRGSPSGRRDLPPAPESVSRPPLRRRPEPWARSRNALSLIAASRTGVTRACGRLPRKRDRSSTGDDLCRGALDRVAQPGSRGRRSRAGLLGKRCSRLLPARSRSASSAADRALDSFYDDVEARAICVRAAPACWRRDEPRRLARCSPAPDLPTRRGRMLNESMKPVARLRIGLALALAGLLVGGVMIDQSRR